MTDTIFKQVNYTAGNLVDFIALGDIGLPDIQRPFVWKNAKVRDLFDSMYRGYPVGYLLFWENAFTEGPKSIGVRRKQRPPRLSSASPRCSPSSEGSPSSGRTSVEERIEIAFDPLQEKFEVADAAIRKDSAFIPNISAVWEKGVFDLADGFLAKLAEAREVGAEERRQVQEAIAPENPSISSGSRICETGSRIRSRRSRTPTRRPRSSGSGSRRWRS